ncbi:hypothetical protein AF61_05925 [Streptococcus uberis EF20/0145]|nr:hypothetical protein AF61_05925 [Streptococcus uberis EF20/0145]
MLIKFPLLKELNSNSVLFFDKKTHFQKEVG